MSLDKVLFVSDTHAPYHNKRAWALMLKAARAWAPDTIVHIGDLVDFYSVSSHSKDPARVHQLKDELSVARRLRAQLDKLGAKRKLFIEGNHENRLQRYIATKAPELYGLLNAPDLLGLRENNWEVTPYGEYARLGKLYLTHDTGQSGKYTTSRALETFQHSVVIGHHHAIQFFVAGDAVGQCQAGAQFGWLGDVKAVDYMSRVKAYRNWHLGFGVGRHDPASGLVFLTPVPIVHYRCCVEGRLVRG